MRTRATNSSKPSSWLGTVRNIALALGLALAIRTLLVQPFTIPSGSMEPTLLVGDYIVVSKPSYGYSRFSFPWGLAPISGRLLSHAPARGDVVVFKLPRDTSIDYVKRIIGLPGDEIEVRDAIVYINGQAARQSAAGFYFDPEESLRPKPRFIEALPDGTRHYVLHWSRQERLDNAGPFKVPEGDYFVMGDNRDDSLDSRVPAARGGVGFVPLANLVGHVELVAASIDTNKRGWADLLQPWDWPHLVRWDRLLEKVH